MPINADLGICTLFTLQFIVQFNKLYLEYLEQYIYIEREREWYADICIYLQVSGFSYFLKRIYRTYYWYIFTVYNF